MTCPTSKEAEVLGPERRRRWTAAEKVSMVRETYEPGMTVSLVARRHQSEPAVPQAQARAHRCTDCSGGRRDLDAALRQIRELQRLLGKKTLEAEILKEAMEVARERKWIARSPLLPGDDR